MLAAFRNMRVTVMNPKQLELLSFLRSIFYAGYIHFEAFIDDILQVCFFKPIKFSVAMISFLLFLHAAQGEMYVFEFVDK